MRALGFQVKKRDVLALVEKVGRDDIGKVDLGDFLHISTLDKLPHNFDFHSSLR